MGINTVLFDLDGTLLDTNELIIESFQHTYRTHLKKEMPREYIIKSFGEILKITMDREFVGCSEEALKTYRSFQVDRFYDYITLHAGVKESIQKLHDQGYKLGVVTSRIYDSAIKGLSHFDLDGYFDVMISADDTDKHKPDPTPIYMALEKLKGKPKDTMMVGDSPYDILCAQNAGAVSVAVAWSALPMEMIIAHNPDYVVDSMTDLMKLIKGA